MKVDFKQNYLVYYPKELLAKKVITGFDMVVYAAFRGQLSTPCVNWTNNRLSITSDGIAYMIYPELTIAECGKKLKQIDDSLNTLILYGIIKAERTGPHRYFAQFDYIAKEIGLFGVCDFNSILTVFATRNYDLVKTYLSILFYRDHRLGKDPEGVAYINNFSQQYLAKELDIKQDTLKDHVAALEQLGVLYVYRSSEKFAKNMMGHIYHKDLIDKYATEHGATKKSVSNTRNSLSNKIAYVSRMGSAAKYDRQTLEELRDYGNERNRWINDSNAKNGTNYPTIDLSVIDRLLDGEIISKNQLARERSNYALTK